MQPYSHNHSCSGIPSLWVLFFVFAFCLLSKRPPLPTTVRCLTPCHSCDLIPPHHLHPSVLGSLLASSGSLLCMSCLSESQKNFFFCFVWFLLASARFYTSNLTLSDSPCNVITETEEGEIVRSALQSNGSVNKITESLNNASGCPFPSSEGKFGPITLALRRLIF